MLGRDVDVDVATILEERINVDDLFNKSVERNAGDAETGGGNESCNKVDGSGPIEEFMTIGSLVSDICAFTSSAIAFGAVTVALVRSVKLLSLSSSKISSTALIEATRM